MGLWVLARELTGKSGKPSMVIVYPSDIEAWVRAKQ